MRVSLLETKAVQAILWLRSSKNVLWMRHQREVICKKNRPYSIVCATHRKSHPYGLEYSLAVQGTDNYLLTLSKKINITISDVQLCRWMTLRSQES